MAASERTKEKEIVECNQTNIDSNTQVSGKIILEDTKKEVEGENNTHKLNEQERMKKRKTSTTLQFNSIYGEEDLNPVPHEDKLKKTELDRTSALKTTAIADGRESVCYWDDSDNALPQPPFQPNSGPASESRHWLGKNNVPEVAFTNPSCCILINRCLYKAWTPHGQVWARNEANTRALEVEFANRMGGNFDFHFNNMYKFSMAVCVLIRNPCLLLLLNFSSLFCTDAGGKWGTLCLPKRQSQWC